MRTKNYLIYGFGLSGEWAFELLRQQKSNRFFIFDSSEEKRKKICEKIKKIQNAFVLTSINKEIVDMCDEIVVSPAISNFDQWVEYAKTKGKVITTEQEVGFLNCKNKLIAITGTNGKTTTVKLVTKILNDAGKKAAAVGNIGYPLCRAILENNRKTIFVCETSSFQLEYSNKFKPKIACILNITPDHLNWHKTFLNYKNAKKKIINNLGRENFFVVNQNLKKEFEGIKAKTIWFGIDKNEKKINCKNGCYIEDCKVIFENKGKKEIICDVKDINMLGNHNLENFLASCSICKMLGVKNFILKNSTKNFSLDRHRIQLVYEKDGVKFFDDSKATNIDATKRALEVYDKNVILILGGSDKGYKFDELVKSFGKNIKLILTCGEVRKKINASIKEVENKSNKTFSLKSFETLKECVTFACQFAKSGDFVLLSPANASFDEFKSYTDRGEKFLEYVKEYFKNSQS